jgi:uncharacterized membrane protein
MELTLVDLTLRWLHFAAGVVWVGHNYASAAQRPRYRPLAPEDLVSGKSERFMAMLNREHGLFRYASIVTWLAGMILLWRRDWLWPAITLDGPLAGIGLGAWIGTVMMLNVWFVLWPNQKRVLGFVEASTEERIRRSRVTFLSARVNTMLSIPLLFFMASSHHGAAILG